MEELKTRVREQVQVERPLLPFFFGPASQHTAKSADEAEEKLALFEKALAQELSLNDTLDEAFAKIVKISLAAEFGPSILSAKGAQKMIATITRGIRDDQLLRRQALALINRYTQKPKAKRK